MRFLLCPFLFERLLGAILKACKGHMVKYYDEEVVEVGFASKDQHSINSRCHWR